MQTLAALKAVAFHSALPEQFMAQRLDVDGPWRRAMKEAEAALEDEGGALAPGLPREGPLALDDLGSDDFEAATPSRTFGRGSRAKLQAASERSSAAAPCQGPRRSGRFGTELSWSIASRSSVVLLFAYPVQ